MDRAKFHIEFYSKRVNSLAMINARFYDDSVEYGEIK